MDALRELDAQGNAVGTSGSTKHSINTFASQSFTFTTNQSVTVDGVPANKVSFETQVSTVGVLTVDTFIFEGCGTVGPPGEQWNVSYGDFKWNINFSSWQWCGCGKGQSVETGEFIDLDVTVKGLADVKAKAGKPQSLELGGGMTCELSGKVLVDNIWTTMPSGYPSVTNQGSRTTFTFRFPRFSSSALYDPLITGVSSASTTTAQTATTGAPLTTGPSTPAPTGPATPKTTAGPAGSTSAGGPSSSSAPAGSTSPTTTGATGPTATAGPKGKTTASPVGSTTAGPASSSAPAGSTGPATTGAAGPTATASPEGKTTASPTTDSQSTTGEATAATTGSSTTAAPAPAPATVQGSMDLNVQDCPAFVAAPGVNESLAAGIAEAANISQSYVAATSRCARRLQAGAAVRRLSELALVDYVITIPPSSTGGGGGSSGAEVAATAAAAAAASIASETPSTLTAKITAALQASGVNASSVSVTSFSAPIVAAPSAATTTAANGSPEEPASAAPHTYAAPSISFLVLLTSAALAQHRA